MEWNGREGKGREGKGMEWNGMEWNRIELNRIILYLNTVQFIRSMALCFEIVKPKYSSCFFSYLNVEIPARIKTAEGLICTRKQKTEAFW